MARRKISPARRAAQTAARIARTARSNSDRAIARTAKRTSKRKTTSTTKKGGHWFHDRMTEQQKRAYLKAHPTSKFHKQGRAGPKQTGEKPLWQKVSEDPKHWEKRITHLKRLRQKAMKHGSDGKGTLTLIRDAERGHARAKKLQVDRDLKKIAEVTRKQRVTPIDDGRVRRNAARRKRK